MMKGTIAITFRIPSEDAEHLDELCRLNDVKRGEFLLSAIRTSYDKLQGSPQLTALLEQMKELTELANKFAGVSDGK